MAYSENTRSFDFSDESDEWKLETPSLDDMTLEHVLDEKESKRDKEQPNGLISLRVTTPGFRAMMRDIAKSYRMSWSHLGRLCLKHGAAILAADPRMVKLTKITIKISSKAMDSGDPEALSTLDRTNQFDFLRSTPTRTTLSVIWWVHGSLSELADVCGVQVPKLAVIAVFASLLTLPNERGYRDILRQEIDAFWRMVERRTRELELGLES